LEQYVSTGGRMSDKEKAMIKILKVLKSMMGVTVKSYREEALTLAKEHGITVEDLIDMAHQIAMSV
jgi:hypothetical protein